MVRQGHFWPKGMWRKKLWERARALDAGFWRLEVRSYRNLDLLSGICDHPCYLVWWKISNSDHVYDEVLRDHGEITCPF